jgi:predicted transcriptional regulator
MAMTLRTDDELDAALTALAQAEGISKQEVIRRAVLERRDRAGHRARVDAIASEVIVEYADALERLGTV